ncbi:Retinal-specific ATP-binding cassette transporter [Clonorchis sinensis]|uniref:Retinal-specific ATP-binding cassette transporter n=1 Tax=Clonorchis sinensis TaxID=79923 RepID=A0A3R7FMN8_CLOSI|nr:Retinal-specific ATP-binding cassette transporter [Clonorchis sinensis]
MASSNPPLASIANAPLFSSHPRDRRRIRRYLSHFRVLLWKNFLLRRRSPFLLTAELTFPILFVCILAGFRAHAPLHSYSACHVQSQSMPSMGLLHYLQSLMCNFNFTCHPHQTPSSHFLEPGTPFYDFLQNLTELLSNERLKQSFTQSNSFLDLDLFSELRPQLTSILIAYSRIPKIFPHPVSNLSLDHLDLSVLRNLSAFVCGAQRNDISRALDVYESSKKSVLNVTQMVLEFSKNVSTSSDLPSGDNPVRRRVQALNFCPSIRSLLSWQPTLRTTGRLRYFLFGRTAYYPSNAFTDSVVNKANEVYYFLSGVKNATKLYFSHIRPQLDALMQNHSERVQPQLQYCLFAFVFLSDEINELCSFLLHFSGPSGDAAQTSGTPHWSHSLEKIDFIVAITEHLLDCMPDSFDRFIPFLDHTEFERFLTLNETDIGFAPLGIHFEQWPTNQTSNMTELYAFAIRVNPFLIDTTFRYKVLDRRWSPAPRRNPDSDMKYFTSGFLDLEERISQAVLSVASTGLQTKIGTNIPYHPVGVEFQMFPSPAFNVDEFLNLFGPHIPQLMILAWSLTVVASVKYLVDEREHGLLMMLRVIGIPNGLSAVSWLSVSMFFSTVTCIVMVLVLRFARITPNTSLSLLVFLILSYVLSILAFSLVFSLFFNKANLAAVVAGGVYFMCYLPAPILLHYETFLSPTLLVTASLLPQVSQTFGWAYIIRLERQGSGAHWSDLWPFESLSSPYSLGLVFILLWGAILVQLVAALYLLPLVRSAFLLCLASPFWGIPRILRSSFSPPVRRPESKNRQFSKTWNKSNTTIEMHNSKPDESLLPPESLSHNSPVVIVRGLYKLYRRYNRCPVLNGIDLRFYRSQTNVLLGHNGAGKTTLLSILAGILKPTKGTVLIDAQEVHWNRDYIRSRVGYCPQHDILYPDMTVSEHIWLYGSLKDSPSALTKHYIDRYLAYFGFESKRNCRISTLSGGQKRKLSVCLAFLGPSLSVILLDEPTAGVDPLSKRIIWNSVQAMKTEDRSVVFTSHHMREAEFLSDRIYILSGGRLLQSGSCVSLKATYGLGYLLTLEKRPGEFERGGGVYSVTKLICTHVPQAVLLAETRNTLLYRLPPEGALSGTYADLFEHLESMINWNADTSPTAWPVSHFGVTDTSLDDVFLTILGKQADQLPAKTSSDISPTHSSRDSIQADAPVFSIRKLGTDLVSRFTSVCRVFPLATKPAAPVIPVSPSMSEDKPFWAIVKRMYYQSAVILRMRSCHLKRNKRVWFLEFFMPCGLILFSLVLFSLYRPQIEQPIMDLHPGLMTDRRHKTQRTFVHHETCPTYSLLRSDELEPIITASAFSRPLSWTGIRCLPSHIYSPRPNFGLTCSNEPHFLWSGSLSEPEHDRSCAGADNNRSELPPWRLLSTFDRLVNLTHLNVSSYVLQSRFPEEFYGGLTLRPIGRHTSDHLLSVLINSVADWFAIIYQPSMNSTLNVLSHLQIPVSTLTDILLPPMERVVLWYNNKGYVSAPAFLNYLFNLQLQQLITPHKNVSHIGIVVANYPLPFPKSTWFYNFLEAFKVEAAFVLFLVIAFTAIPANFAVLLVTERHLGIKHLQRVSGMQPYAYWLVNFVWDFFIYSIPVLFCTILLVVFRKTAYTSPAVIGPFVLIVILYGSAMTPLVYLATMFFHHPSTAYVLIGAVNVFIASVTLSISVFLKLLLLQDPSETVQTTINHIQRTLLYLFPHHCLGSSVFDLAVNGFLQENGLSVAPSIGMASFTWLMLYPRMLCMMGQTMLFVLLLLLVEYRGSFWYIWDGGCLWRSSELARPPQLDNMGSSKNVPLCTPEIPTTEIRIQHLSKRYFGQSRPALSDLNLCVRAGECFGLLGTNGAGKSTTFGLLTGRFPAPRNTIFLNGMDLSKQFFTGHCDQSIGYCPQQDALHSFLTVRETLQSYARLRGLSGSHLEATVSKLIISTGLDAHADRLVRTLSGGTKRKLSTAIAFIGDPQILLLDEPSSGMDPGARRLLWSHINSALERQRCILLSSHCMEECETLCNRVGLLVEGRLQCDGTPLELKLRFAVGYSVDFELSPSALLLPPDQLQSELRKYLPLVTLSLPLCIRQQYQYPHIRPLSQLFRALQKVRELGFVCHYSVKHSNLEDAFVECLTSCSDSSKNDRPPSVPTANDIIVESQTPNF